jgi:GTP 3',8-cyclase
VGINCVIRKSRFEEDAVAVAEFCKLQGLQIRFIRMMNLENGEFSVVDGGEGGNCKICNRLRVTANGKIKPCLFSDQEYDIRQLGLPTAYRLALAEKPCCGSTNQVGSFYNIGG